MMSRLLPAIELTSWPLIMLVIFFSAFLLLIVRVYSPSRKAQLQQESRMPLDEDA